MIHSAVSELILLVPGPEVFYKHTLERSRAVVLVE